MATNGSAATSPDLQAIAQQLISGDNFDITLLDQIVGAAYDPVSPHRAQANKALMQLQEAPELWRMADSIIEQSQNPNSRFFGLQVLDDAIKTRYVMRKIQHNESSLTFLYTLCAGRIIQ
jgi:exportin-1